MQRLRSIWGLRVLVIVLMIGLLPAILGPKALAAQPSSADAYASWLSDYLVSPEEPVVARALETAASSKAPTFDHFLRVFVQSLEAQHSDIELADVFSVSAQSTDELVRLLYGQYQQVLGGVPSTRATISATPSALSGIPDRMAGILPGAEDDAAAAHRPFSILSSPSDVTVVTPVRIYSAELPQGP